MDEASVGITAFVSPGVPGFTGIFKARCSDFVVREVDPSGRTVQLCEPARRGQLRPAARSDGAGDAVNGGARRALEQAVAPDELRALEALASAAGADAHDGVRRTTLSVGSDKARRTAVHLAIRALFPALASETSEDGASIIAVVKSDAQRLEPANKRARFAEQAWPGGALKYVHFVLVKENRDTLDVLDSLARALGCRPSVFSFAGIKDRRAVTVQRVSAFKVHPDRLGAIGERSALGVGVRLGGVRFAADPVRCGELAGNHFTIVLRAVPADEVAHVHAAAAALRERGFVNYYGLQRFGNNPAAPTHFIGRALLTRRWRDAIDLILAPRAGENPAVHAAREAYARTRDPAEGLRLMPAFMARERSLLEGLVRHGDADLMNTINRISRKVRTLYLHAYQSCVWNRVASERIRLCPDAPIVGDLVHVTADGRPARGAIQPDSVGAPAEAVDANDGADADAAAAADVEGGGELRLSAVAVRALTHDDVESAAFSIFDVILPLPGTHVTYPANALGGFYASLMAEDGLDPNDMDRRVREHALSGTYRKLVIRPGDATHELITYADPNAQLVPSDLDVPHAPQAASAAPAVSYTHLTLPTKRIR